MNSQTDSAAHIDSTALLRAPGVAAAMLGTAPAWLWNVDEGRILLASAAGIGFFGESGLEALSARQFDMRRPAMAQLARLGGTLPRDGAPQLALLRFFVGFRDVSVPCQCRLIGEAGQQLVLAVASSGASKAEIGARAKVVLQTLTSALVLKGPTGEIFRNPATADLSADTDDASDVIEIALSEGTFQLIFASRQAETDAGTSAAAIPVSDALIEAETPNPEIVEPEPAEDELEPSGPVAPPIEATPSESQASPAGAVHRELPDTRRFTFLFDPDGRFIEVGAGFAALVGPMAADIVGKAWRDIDGAADIDPKGQLAQALQTRNTWSDIHIHWPTDFGEVAELRLSALPRFGEGRSFVGFRGFADVLSVTPVEREVPETEASDTEGPEAALVAAGAAAIDEQPADEPLTDGPSADTGGTHTESPEDSAAPEEGGTSEDGEPSAADLMFMDPDDAANLAGGPDDQTSTESSNGSKVHQLRPLQVIPKDDGTLNDRERTAFKAIAEALGARWQGDESDQPPPAEEDAGDTLVEPAVDAPEPAVPEDVRPEDTALEAEVAEPELSEPESGEPEGEKTEAEAPQDLEPEESVQESADQEDAGPDVAGQDVAQPKLIGDVLDRVPLGLAIVRDERLLAANRAFLELFDFADIAELEAAGGLGVLLEGRGEGEVSSESAVMARRRDGSTFAIEAQLGRTPWVDGPAMLMSAREAEPAIESLSGTEPAPAAAAGATTGAATATTAELQAILDTALDGVISLDGSEAILSANASAGRLFGIDSTDIIGRPFADFIVPGDRSVAGELLESLRAGGPDLLQKGCEISILGPQGKPAPVLLTMAWIGAAGDEVSESQSGGICVVLRDLSDWKETETDLVAARKRAEDASAQKSDFLAKMSHEIRTPLNGIIGFSEIMLEERFGPIGNDRYREYIKDIHQSGEHLMSLINDLLDLSKVEAGKLEMSFTGVRLNELVEQSVTIMQPQSSRSRVIVRTSLGSAVPAVVADVRSIRQVLLNLLSNAIKFTPPGGQVIVSTALNEDGEVFLRIRDTGPGMSESDVAMAMEPFRQLPVAPSTGASAGASSSDGERGTGLGLPLAKALVEANRANFSIQSTVGEGTLVEVSFLQNRVLAE